MNPNSANHLALSIERLTDWVEGRLSEADAAIVAAQFAQADAETHDTVAWLRAWKERQGKTVLVTPPVKAHAAVLNLFRERQPAGLIRQIFARLVSGGDRPRLALSGIRGNTVKAAQRRLTYETDVADITVMVQAQNKRFNLSGQVFLSEQITAPATEQSQTPFTVQLLQSAVEHGITTANALGEFSFKAIPIGSYELVLSNGQFDIHVTPIELHV